MEKHITLLGVLYIIHSVTALVLGVIVILTFFGVETLLAALVKGFPPLPLTELSRAGWLIGLTLIAVSLPGVLAGAGLLRLKSWGRKLALIAAFVFLFQFPIGTALSFYAFWILLSKDCSRRFAEGS